MSKAEIISLLSLSTSMAIMPRSVVGNKTEVRSDAESVLEEKIGLNFKGLTFSPLFKIEVGTASQSVRYSAKTAWAKTDDHVESG